MDRLLKAPGKKHGILGHICGVQRPHVTVVRRISGINCGRELREAALWGWKKVCFGCTSQVDVQLTLERHLILEILSLRQPNLNHSIDRSTELISASV